MVKIAMLCYTDGGCHGNPGPGAWAFVLVDDGNIKFENSGFSEETTNNKMELQAVIEALKYLKSNTSIIELYTDSIYVKQGISSWIHNWKKNGWRTANKKPVKNQEYWRELDSLVSQIDVDWRWVKGHSGNLYNERCDELVQIAIRNRN
jgi:ribonuclease HI